MLQNGGLTQRLHNTGVTLVTLHPSIYLCVPRTPQTRRYGTLTDSHSVVHSIVPCWHAALAPVAHCAQFKGVEVLQYQLGDRMVLVRLLHHVAARL